MPKRKNQYKATPKLFNHLRTLGIESIPEYQAWCDDHGFGTGLNKPNKMLARERRFQLAAQRDLLSQKRTQSKVHDHKLLLSIVTGGLVNLLEAHGHLRAFQNFTRQFYHPIRSQHLPDLSNLIRLIEHLTNLRSRLVDPCSNCVSIVDGGVSIAESLAFVAAKSQYWKRPVTEWKPRSKNVRKQFRSLVRHLLDQYGEVPEMMDQAWAIGLDQVGNWDPKGIEYRRWWVDLGAGFNLRKLYNLPIKVTKRMAHLFMRAPDDLTIPRALRWAQVCSLGGNDQMARAIAATRLGESFEDEDFWTSVIRWFIDQPAFNPSQYGPIIDFLQAHRLEHPNMTMRGRTPQSMLRSVDAWHRSLADDHRFYVGQWTAMGIPEFTFEEASEESENHRIWRIRELLSGKSLVTEGRKMKHCVASYTGRCKSGQSSIWTLELTSFGGLEKRITIELHPATKTIVQARGKNNRVMTKQERAIVLRWCTQANLKIAHHVF